MTELESMLSRGSSWLNAWLLRIETEKQALPQELILLGIGQGAAFEARRALSLEWASVAVRSYELCAQLSGESERHSALISAMMLRAFLISKLGSVGGHAILDPQKIFEWFDAELTRSFDEILETSAHWSALPANELVDLRRLKNRLSVIKFLTKSGGVPAGAHFERWLRLCDRLP